MERGIIVNRVLEVYAATLGLALARSQNSIFNRSSSYSSFVLVRLFKGELGSELDPMSNQVLRLVNVRHHKSVKETDNAVVLYGTGYGYVHVALFI
jgi:hypothetical protein